jgi:hypothetical protein
VRDTPFLRRAVRLVAGALLVPVLATTGCGFDRPAYGTPTQIHAPAPVLAPPDVRPEARVRYEQLLDDLERRTFQWFWDTADPMTGLVPDRWPAKSFSSVAAVGFGLATYCVGAERGWVRRDEARDRALKVLRFLWDAPQGPDPQGMTGHRGFFYHFLDMKTGRRWASDVELSTIDTTLCVAGALVAARYFDGATAEEAELRDLVRRIYERIDWDWAQSRPPRVAMAWWPEKGFGRDDYRGYDEALILYLLALGSPTHPATDGAWEAFCSTYDWGEHEGQVYVNFAPLFGHQFSHVFVDFHGIQDAFLRSKGIDYFENSRRAVLAQRAYAIRNPLGFRGYQENVWGLSACDGPADGSFTVEGRVRRFLTYGARGVSRTWSNDDGTITPMAAAASLPFAPEVVLPALAEMKRLYGESIFGTYGFFDAFNPTFRVEGAATPLGKVVPGVGWVATNHLGIDQGPIVLMIENHRSGLLWRLMRGSPSLVAGLRRAGFSGGWLQEATH